MTGHFVLVRAWGGEPLKRVVISASRALVYAANPESLARIASGETDPVGFPVVDVFEFDEERFAALAVTWKTVQRTEPPQWEGLQPYGPKN